MHSIMRRSCGYAEKLVGFTMNFKNTQTRYGIVSAALHWVMGLAMIGLIVIGLLLAQTELIDNRRFFMGLHKSFGIIVLVMVVFRIIWRFMNAAPPLPVGTKPWQKWASHGVHFALYASMIIMPLSGWAMSSAYGYPVNVFGWFELPSLMAVNKPLGGVFRRIHEIAGFALAGMIAVHIGAALMHHFVYKDNVLKRMLTLDDGA